MGLGLKNGAMITIPVPLVILQEMTPFIHFLASTLSVRRMRRKPNISRALLRPVSC